VSNVEMIALDGTAPNSSGERTRWAEAAVRALARGATEYAVVSLDTEGRLLTWNEGARRLLGCAKEDVIGEKFFDRFLATEHGAPHQYKRLLKEAESAGSAEGELWMMSGSGTRLLARSTISAVRGEYGVLLGFTWLMHDLTESRLVEASMRQFDAEGQKYRAALTGLLQKHTARFREADELFRQLTVNIPHAIWIRETAHDTIRYINPAWSKMTGIPAQAGDPIEKIYSCFHPDDLPLAMRESRKFPDGGVDFDCRILRPDKSALWVRVRTFPIADTEGKVIRVAGIIEDITARRAETKRMEKLKDEFVATVSHELRTPLTSIVGSLGLLVRNSSALPESVVRLTRIAHENSERLVRLINSILDVERISSGSLPFQMDRVRILSVVQQTVESVRGLATASGIDVQLDDASVDCEVSADPDRLAQAVTNLLANAIHFSPSGAPVSVSIRKITRAVRVSVRDRGPGIPESFKPRIFERFAQADSSDNRKKGGTGLGLSITKEIVNRLGGEIGFEDTPGGGTTFYFELPEWAALTKEERSTRRAKPAAKRNAA
jgi:PAS domain S-box-containing protein